MSKDSISIVNVEPYLLRSDGKASVKKVYICLIFIYVGFGKEKQGQHLQLMQL